MDALKRKSLIVLLFLIPAMAVTLVYLRNSQSQPVFRDSSEDDIKVSEESEKEDTSDVISVSPTPVTPPTISELMEELNSDKQPVAEERLVLLTREESALGYYSNLILANRYDSEGRDASGYYRTALSLYPTNEVHFRLAEHLLKEEKIEEAENEYLKLLPDDIALQTLIKLGTKPFRIGEAYINKKQWKAAEEWLFPLVEENSGEDINVELIKYYAQALSGQNNLKKALPFYKKLYEIEPTDSGIAWWYARCLESSGQSTAAVEIYFSIGEKGAYRRGIILQNKGRTMEAADVLSSSNEAISIWRAARIWDTAGMTEKAIEAYSHIAEITSSYQDDAAYRAYVLSKRIGSNDMDKLMDLLSKHPAWMVRIENEPVMPEVADISYDWPDYLKLAAKYEEEGYTDAAAIEIAIGSKNTDLEEKLSLGDWYLEREEPYNAILWGIRSLNDKPTRRGYELAYPQGFKELVIEASKKYDLEAALLWAVIREESHFKHDAKSSAGAMGLMQIMPPTGKDIASRLGVTMTENDLLNPEKGIKFGSFYVNSMLNMFSGDMDKAMAAYNGGAGNVKKWLESSFGTLDEDFPTAITFPETQEYITKVANSYHIYKWLYE
ncbi:MAG: transglycosylase SLT domain-containing protein [Ruminiclostridium sp.]|nr:transglycosylase SLT domain-containing protein [Ruminiclostridium sp.]